MGRPRLMQVVREARASLERGEFSTAEALARQALAHDLREADGLEVLSEALLQQGRSVEALAATREVLALYRALHAQNSMVFGLHLLHEHGFRPRGLVDIGAYEGSFSLLARQFWPVVPVLMIEPQARQRQQLDRVAAELGGDIHVESALLGARPTPAVTFHQLDTPWGSTGSSIFPEVSSHDVTSVAMPMTTLDHVLATLPGRQFDFLKLDVQGAELEVLRGAVASLPQVEVVFAEVSLHECNRGAPRLAEVVAALDEADFAMFDLLPTERDGRSLRRQVDTIFVRRSSSLW